MEKDHEATLLVMDNDRLSLAIITSILSKHLPHLHVLNPIDNGKLAIQACTGHHPPNLLLADISMTDINGLTVCKTIRRDNMTTKILMMSSFDIGGYAQAAFDAGAQGIIHKDSPQTILTAVRRVAAGQPLSYEGIRFQTPARFFPQNQRSENQGAFSPGSGGGGALVPRLFLAGNRRALESEPNHRSHPSPALLRQAGGRQQPSPYLRMDGSTVRTQHE